MNLRHLEYSTGAALGILAFGLYMATLCPTVSFIDSGELASVACTLGIAHPTGYPLFSMVSWIFTHIPLGLRPIYQVNMMAALFCALAVFFFFRLFVFFTAEFMTAPRKRTSAPDMEGQASAAQIIVPGAFAALVLAFSKTYWSQALAVEVYSLHMLLLSVLLLVFTRAAWASVQGDPGRERLWKAAALVLGLSFTNHMTTILLVPAFAYMYFAVQGFSRASWKRLLSLALPFLAGFSAYLYLPVRAGAGSLMNWGNPVTPERLFWHFSGKVYRVWIFSSTESAAKQFNYFLRNLPGEFAVLPLIVGAVGIYYLYRERKRAFIFVLLLFFGCLFYSINYDIHDIDSYFLLCYISIALMAGVGAWKLMELARARKFGVPMALLLALVCIALVFHSYREVDQSNDRVVEEYTHDMFNSIGQNGIVISYQWDDFVSAAYYLQLVEHERPDVTVIDKELLRRSWYFLQLARRYPWLIEQSKKEVDAFAVELEKFEHDRPYTPAVIEYRYAALIRSFIEKNLPTRPVYVTGEIESQYTAGFQRVPSGLAFRLYADTLRHEIGMPVFTGKPRLDDDPEMSAIMGLYTKAYVNNAIYMNILGERRKALELTTKALELNPEYREALSLKEQLSFVK